MIRIALHVPGFPGVITLFIFLAGGMALSPSLFSWGNEAHRVLTVQTIRNLPFSMQKFRDDEFFFADHAGDADRRKANDLEEASRHYIELERYPEFFSGTLPSTLIELQQFYSESSVQANGILPYIIMTLSDSLTTTIRLKDWRNARKITADLTHYIADIYAPLNTTTNYDGQATGNHGIKWRYEIELMDRYYQHLYFKRIEPKKIDDLRKIITAALTFSHAKVNDILAADAKAYETAKEKYNSTYYSEFWKNASRVTNDLMQQASTLMTNILFTAWTNAGGSKIEWEDEFAEGFRYKDPKYLEQNYPNPFNPVTTIKYTLPDQFYTRVSVVNLFGQVVALLHEGMQGAGKYEYNFNAEQLPGGIYFVRLQMNDRTEARKMILQK